MDGGAVMAPRKKRVVSRSKSKTTSKSKTAMSSSLPTAPITAQSHANFTPIRQAYGQVVPQGQSSNTFELATKSAHHQHNSSFGPQASVQSATQLKPSASAHFAPVNLDIPTGEDPNVKRLEQQLEQMRLENSKLSATVSKQNEIIAQMRQSYNSGQPAQVIDHLTEEMQKAHDLEYLCRSKERQIEILRGDVTEARNLKQISDENFEKVQAQNMCLLNDNSTLQEDNFRLKEALDHAMRNCEHLKSEKNQMSSRFGYLTNEMVTLRELANELKSSKPHTQVHTKA